MIAQVEQDMKHSLLFENAPWAQGDLWHTEEVLLKGPISANQRSRVWFCNSQRGGLSEEEESGKNSGKNIPVHEDTRKNGLNKVTLVVYWINLQPWSITKTHSYHPVVILTERWGVTMWHVSINGSCSIYRLMDGGMAVTPLNVTTVPWHNKSQCAADIVLC